MTDITEIGRLVDGYRDWLKDRTAVRSLHAGWVEITTPFLDRHNDYLQIYARGEDGGIRLTDDGHTLRDLEASGCALDTPRRRSILMTALNGFGIEESNGALRTLATPTNFAFRKHALLQAILAVNDMFYLSSSSVKTEIEPDKVCRNCDWLGAEDTHDAGSALPGPTCRRHAPVATGGMMSGSRTMWPVVQPTDWCGELEHRTK